MSTPRIKEPTKKAFHFPKSVKEPAAEGKKASAKATRASSAKQAEAASPAGASAPGAAKTAPKRTKAASSVETGASASKVAEKTARAAPAAKDAKDVKAGKAPKAATAVKSPSVPAAVEEKKVRAKKEKEKVVRDSFTMPKSDYAKIAELKQRCLDAGVPVKKSELLRAGLNLLAVSPAKRLIAAVQELEAVKTGRPAKS